MEGWQTFPLRRMCEDHLMKLTSALEMESFTAKSALESHLQTDPTRTGSDVQVPKCQRQVYNLMLLM